MRPFVANISPEAIALSTRTLHTAERMQALIDAAKEKGVSVAEVGQIVDVASRAMLSPESVLDLMEDRTPRPVLVIGDERVTLDGRNPVETKTAFRSIGGMRLEDEKARAYADLMTERIFEKASAANVSVDLAEPTQNRAQRRAKRKR